MPNGTYGGVRGRKTKVGRKLSFSSYSIQWLFDAEVRVYVIEDAAAYVL